KNFLRVLRALRDLRGWCGDSAAKLLKAGSLDAGVLMPKPASCALLQKGVHAFGRIVEQQVARHLLAGQVVRRCERAFDLRVEGALAAADRRRAARGNHVGELP